MITVRESINRSLNATASQGQQAKNEISANTTEMLEGLLALLHERGMISTTDIEKLTGIKVAKMEPVPMTAAEIASHVRTLKLELVERIANDGGTFTLVYETDDAAIFNVSVTLPANLLAD